MSLADCLRAQGDETLLVVRVTPKSSKDAIETVEQDDAGRSYLKVRVRAVPENGAANKAVCQLVSKRLGLSKSAVRLHAGGTSRVKQLLLPFSEEEALQQLRAIVSA